MATRDDAQLLKECRDGDEEAWSLLVERYSALILSIPYRYGFKRVAAEEVFSDVCLALVRALHTIRDPQSLPQWLIRTASRATWDQAKKAKASPPDDLPPLTGAAPPREFVEQLEEEQIVRAALAELGERCRRLLTLLYFASPDLSYDEVSQRMKMPRGSLGPTRRRCLDKMRGQLPPGLGGDVSKKGRKPS
jgi:RNA polymerase sigma factor (sigma-70 family)